MYVVDVSCYSRAADSAGVPKEEEGGGDKAGKDQRRDEGGKEEGRNGEDVVASVGAVVSEGRGCEWVVRGSPAGHHTRCVVVRDSLFDQRTDSTILSVLRKRVGCGRRSADVVEAG